MLFVGLPCHIQAIRKIQSFYQYNLKEDSTDSVAFQSLSWFKDIDITIGLFCKENIEYKYLKKLIEEVREINCLTKMTIENNSIELFFGDERIDLEIYELRKLVHEGCRICSDFSSNFSDISVGSMGSPTGWSTLITRSEKGSSFVLEAIRRGYIEVSEVDKKQLDRIRKMDIKKRESAIKEMNKHLEGLPIFYNNFSDIKKKEIYELTVNQNCYVLDFFVISRNICIKCGACASICPTQAFEFEGELPRIKGECHKKICGACFIICPKANLAFGCDEIQLITKFYTNSDAKKIYSARSTMQEILKNSQDGGVVTSLIKFGLETRKIKKALVTSMDQNEKWKPKSCILRTTKKLTETSKSKYSLSSPFLPFLQKSFK